MERWLISGVFKLPQTTHKKCLDLLARCDNPDTMIASEAMKQLIELVIDNNIDRITINAIRSIGYKIIHFSKTDTQSEFRLKACLALLIVGPYQGSMEEWKKMVATDCGALQLCSMNLESRSAQNIIHHVCLNLMIGNEDVQEIFSSMERNLEKGNFEDPLITLKTIYGVDRIQKWRHPFTGKSALCTQSMFDSLCEEKRQHTSEGIRGYQQSPYLRPAHQQDEQRPNF
jgi:hypothetical protein